MIEIILNDDMTMLISLELDSDTEKFYPGKYSKSSLIVKIS